MPAKNHAANTTHTDKAQINTVCRGLVSALNIAAKPVPDMALKFRAAIPAAHLDSMGIKISKVWLLVEVTTVTMALN